MKRHEVNVASIAIVARRLAELDIQFVFTGGAVVGLLLTDSAAADVRPTEDVDVIVAVSTYADYALLQEKLRDLGFKHDMDGPNCRFVLEEITVDVMPAEGKVLGFNNRWYQQALDTATEFVLPDSTCIHIVTAPAFVATKLDAFQDRGANDFIMSHDIEDIIAVVDGRSELKTEIENAPPEIRQYIREVFANLLTERDFIESVKMSLLPDQSSQARAGLIIERMNEIARLQLGPD